MRTFVVLSAVLACANAGVLLNAPGLLASPLALTRTVSVAAPVVAAPALTSSQYHAQDELGQFQYGYAGGPSSKAELKTLDGVTRGSYNYVDANGVLQSVSYIADPVNGFRVAATNLPVAPALPEAPKLVGPAPVQDTPEVAAARAAHEKAIAEARARSAEPEAAPAPAPVAVVAVAPPQVVQDTPEVAQAKIAHEQAHRAALAAALASPA